jgi:hypothetical protein
MKYIIRFAVTLGLSVFTSLAQQHSRGPGGPPGKGHLPVPPLMAALDTDSDGELSETEIAKASTALKTLDKNNDGKLSAEELTPPPPGGTNQSRLAPPPGANRPVPPIMAVLDTNGDGELDATEITNAKDSLLQLDVSGDGKLSRDELRPKGQGGPGGPRGPGGPGGPDAPPTS